MDTSLTDQAQKVAEKLARGHPTAEDLMMAAGVIARLIGLIKVLEEDEFLRNS